MGDGKQEPREVLYYSTNKIRVNLNVLIRIEAAAAVAAGLRRQMLYNIVNILLAGSKPYTITSSGITIPVIPKQKNNRPPPNQVFISVQDSHMTREIYEGSLDQIGRCLGGIRTKILIEVPYSNFAVEIITYADFSGLQGTCCSPKDNNCTKLNRASHLPWWMSYIMEIYHKN